MCPASPLPPEDDDPLLTLASPAQRGRARGPFRRRAWGALLLILVILGAWAWVRHTSPLTLQGEIAGNDEIQIPAPRAGTVAEIFVQPGDDVENGAPVLRFALPEAELARAEALAGLAFLQNGVDSGAGQSTLQTLRKLEDAAGKEAEEAAARHSQATYARRKLEQTGQRGHAALRAAREAEAKAEERYAAAHKRFEQFSQARARTAVQMRQSQALTPKERDRETATLRARLAKAEQALEKTLVLMPVQARVRSVYAAVGDEMRAGQPVALLTRAGSAAYRAVAWTNERTARKLEPGMACAIALPDRDASFSGMLTGIMKEQPLSPETPKEKKYKVEAEIFSPDAARVLRAGMQVRIVIRPGALTSQTR